MLFTARASGVTLRQGTAGARGSRTTSKNWAKQSGGVRPLAVRPRPTLPLSIEEPGDDFAWAGAQDGVVGDRGRA